MHCELCIVLPHAAFEGDAEEALGFDGKFHWELLHHVAGVTVDDESHGVFGANAALVAVENLVLIDFTGSGLMLHDA